MAKKIEFIPCIPLEKSYVHGYYERRNGKMVWVSPYENSKDKNKKPGNSTVTTIDAVSGKTRKPDIAAGNRVPEKQVNVAQTQNQSINYILDAIISMVKTIRSFEDGEIVRLAGALKTCKSIISELGYLDDTIVEYFKVPAAKRTRLDEGAERETAAMAKEAKRLSRRVTKSTLREKIQKLGEQFEEAL